MLFVPCVAAEARTFDIEAGTNDDGSMYLRPDRVQVAPGDVVTLRVKNVDTIFHDVAILGYGGRDIEIEVPKLRTEEATFTADTQGEFRMVCEVTGHKQKGMQGVFVVGEEKDAPGAGAAALVGAIALLTLARRR